MLPTVSNCNHHDHSQLLEETHLEQDCTENNRKYIRPLIVLEGNIGVGKSTLLNQLYEQYSEYIHDIYLEPVDEWRSYRGVNVLEKNYESPTIWSFTLQIQVFLSMHARNMRIERQLEKITKSLGNIKNGFVIQERSLSSANMFINVLEQNNIIKKTDIDLLRDIYDRFGNDSNDTYVTIYLRTTPDVAYDRVQHRSNTDDRLISLDFLKLIHVEHEKQFMSKQTKNVYVIDANESIDNVVKQVIVCLKYIKNTSSIST